jgi:predicted nucleic acid-binding protein
VRRARCLADTSVIARGRQASVSDVLDELVIHGRLWTCRMVDLELLYSAQSNAVDELATERRSLPEAPITPDVLDRAFEVMESLRADGHRRTAKPADCIIAASAELAGLTVLHYDRDFDRIAEVTGQNTEWVAPAGSLDT